MSELSKVVDKIIAIHRVRYMTDSSEMAPMVITYRGGEPLGVYIIPDMMNPDLKHLSTNLIASIVDKDHADGYVLSSEAWMADFNGTNRTPSEREDRIEVVITAGYNPNESEHRIHEIVRDYSDGRVIDLVNKEMGGMMQSRFNIYEN